MQSTFAFVIILFSPSCCLSFSQRRHRSGLKDSVFDLLSARKVIGSSAVPNLSASREGRSQLNFTSSTKAMRFTAKPKSGICLFARSTQSREWVLRTELHCFSCASEPRKVLIDCFPRLAACGIRIIPGPSRTYHPVRR
jgi:exo-beta-1,3-glucanase (GH17 family)